MRAPKGRVKEGITPRGDGNSNLLVGSFLHVNFVKEGITPRGDGNGSLEEVL